MQSLVSAEVGQPCGNLSESFTARSAFCIGSSKGAFVMLMLYLIRMEKVSCTGGAVMFCVPAIFL